MLGCWVPCLMQTPLHCHPPQQIQCCNLDHILGLYWFLYLKNLTQRIMLLKYRRGLCWKTYHRHLAEFKTGAERKDAAKSTLLAYKAAQDIALVDLAPTHPISLGLALNFSVFYYEILNSPDRACNLAKQINTCNSFYCD